MAQQNGSSGNDFLVKAGLAQMLKGGVIMDVVNAEQVGLQNLFANRHRMS
jgi:pyridoxal 5'-phosphate synthase pdxS subunit